MILVVAAIQVVAWATFVPPLQGPDELNHFGYVQYLAETGKTPLDAKSKGPGPFSTETREVVQWLGLQPLLGNTAARPEWSGADMRHIDAIERGLRPGQRADGSGPNAVGQNPPLYYLYAAAAYHLSPRTDVIGRVFFIRLASGLLYLATVVLMWMIAGEVFGARSWLRPFSTAVVALQPKLASLGATINPDDLLVTLYAAFILLAIKLVRRPSVGKAVGLSAVTAAAILTHGRGFGLLLPAIVVLAIAALRLRPSLRQVLGVAGAVVLFGVASFGIYTLTKTHGTAYGGEIGKATAESFNARQFGSYMWQFYFPKLSFMQPMLGPPYGYRQFYIETFYGAFAALELNYPGWVYDLLQVLTALGLVALYTTFVRNIGVVRREWRTLVVLAIVPLSTIALLHLVAYRDLLLDHGTDPLLSGRYLLPLIPVFGLAVAWVVGRLPRRVAPFAAAGVLSLGVLLEISGLGMALARFYG